MPRDNEQHHWALIKHLGEYGLSHGPPQGIDSADGHEKHMLISIAFSTGWREAQKWEVTEAQRQGIAVQAMNGLLASDTDYPSAEKMAEDAYTMADAMIAQAAQPHGLKLAAKIRAIKKVLNRDDCAYDSAMMAGLIIDIINEDEATIERLGGL